MGRKPRAFQPGKIYHIVQRGHNRAHVFDEQIDKSSFLEIIRKSQKSCPFQLLYYVLMDNHYHLVVEMQSDSLDNAMHRINMSYCRLYNRKYHRSGTVFGGRYKSYPVTDQAYFVKLIQYVANNPVKAGIVSQPSDYRWCAHAEVVSSKNGIVAATRLFELLGGAAIRGRKAYDRLIRQLVLNSAREAARKAVNSTGDRVTSGSASGSDNGSACDQVFGKNCLDHDDACDIEFDRERRMEQLKAMLGRVFNLDKSLMALICSRNREPHTIQLRRQFVQQAIDQGFTIAEIARLLNISPRCVREHRHLAEGSLG